MHWMLLPIGGHRSDSKRIAFVKLDPLDYQWARQHRWIIHDANGTRYAKRALYTPGDSNTRVRMHRELLGLPPGKVPEVDHINGDGLDNRRENLRMVTSAQNGQNRRRSDRGASLDKRRGTWSAYGHLDRHKHWIGSYATREEALAAAAAWRQEHMPFACGGILP